VRVGHFHELATLSLVTFERETEPAATSGRLWHEENNSFFLPRIGPNPKPLEFSIFKETYCTEGIYSVYRQYTQCVQTVETLCTDSIRSVYRQYTQCVQTVYTVCTDSIRSVYRQYIQCVQTVYTVCTRINYKIVRVNNLNKYLHYGTSRTE
jgi:hypothetical protein